MLFDFLYCFVVTGRKPFLVSYGLLNAFVDVSFVLSSIAITSLGEEGAGRCAGRLFVCPRSVFSWFTTLHLRAR